MTWIVLGIGLLLPIVALLAAPFLLPLRRLAGVDQTARRRIYLSRQLLVEDEDGRTEMLLKYPTPNRDEQFQLWWMRQPMRTGDDPLAINELAVSPISIVPYRSDETRVAAMKSKPPRMKVHTRREPVDTEDASSLAPVPNHVG